MSISRFMAGLFSRNSVKSSRKRRAGRAASRSRSRIGVEQLEDRRLLAITYMKVASVHTFTGDGADDSLTLSFNSTFTQLTYNFNDGSGDTVVPFLAGDSITFDGDGGADALTLNGPSTNDNVTINGGAITYAGKAIGLANVEIINVNTGGGDDTVSVIATNADTTIDGRGDNDVVTVTAGAGVFTGSLNVKNANKLVVDDSSDIFAKNTTITDTSVDATGTTRIFPLLTGGVQYSGLNSVRLNTGTAGDTVNVNSTKVATTVFNAGAADLINVNVDTVPGGTGDLDRIAGKLTIAGANGSQHAILDDSTGPATTGVSYTLTAASVSLSPLGKRTFAGVDYDTTTSFVELTGTNGANQYDVFPASTTKFGVNAGTSSLDQLVPAFAGLTAKTLTFKPGSRTNGTWSFGNARDVEFTAIEKFKYFPILTIGSDAGPAPLRARVYDAATLELVTEFIPYGAFTGGVRVASGDLNGDGIPEIVTAPGVGHVAEFVVRDLVNNSSTSVLNTVADPDPMGGYQIAVGDVTGDAKNDIVTSTGPGVMNVIRVYVNESPQVGDAGYTGAVTLLRNQAKFPQILPYFIVDPNFVGGSTVGVGDFNRDGIGDIAIGSGPDTRPNPTMRATVRVLDTKSFSFVRDDFLPFGAGLYFGGVNIAVADINLDGTPDVVAGTQTGSRGFVEVLDGFYSGRTILRTASAPTQLLNIDPVGSDPPNSPIQVATVDIDGDGIPEIFTGQSAAPRKIKRFTVSATVPTEKDFTPLPVGVGDTDTGAFFLR